MWKRLSVLFVFSVLVLSQVLALGTFFTEKLGMDPSTKEGMERLLNEAAEEIRQKDLEISSQSEYIKNLEIQLKALSQDSQMLVSKAETLQSQLMFYQNKAKTLENSLAVLKSGAENSSSLLGIATTDSEEKDKEIKELETIPVRRSVAPLLGVGATWDPSTDTYGATLDLGVRLNKFAFLVGAEYSPAEWKLEVPDISELVYSAGFQVEF